MSSRSKDVGCAFQRALRTTVGAEEGKVRFGGKRTDGDDSNPTDGSGTFPELRGECAGKEEKEIKTEVEHSSYFAFRTLADGFMIDGLLRPSPNDCAFESTEGSSGLG